MRVTEKKSGYILKELIEEQATILKDKVYLQFKEKENITYKQLDERVNQVANSLRNLGVKKNDKVCIFSPNFPEYLYTWFGAAKLGAVEVPTNTFYKGDILQYVINNSEAKVMVADQHYLDRIKFVEKDLGRLETIVVLEGGEPLDESLWKGMKFRFVPFKEFYKASKEPPSVELRHSDPAAIQYTSGTTGPSKGVVMSNNNVCIFARNFTRHLQLNEKDIIHTSLPLFHAAAQMLAAMSCLWIGGTLILYDQFSASTFWDEIKRCKATAFIAIGAMINILMKQPERPDDADNNIRIAFAVPAPADIHLAFEKRFNLKLREGYGSSEQTLVTVCPLENFTKIGSCGVPLEAYEVKIVDDDDNELPPHQVGEIISRPKEPFSMMSCYYNMPDKTLEAFRNLWYHSGDYGYRDEDGYFYFVDRKKDAMRRRGENISSYEVEKVVNSHPSVLESAAVATKSELGEDEVKIVVVLQGGQKLTPEALVAYCEERMAYFMVPRYVEFKNALPKTPTEKIEKYKLREEGITANTWDREKAGYKLKR